MPSEGLSEERGTEAALRDHAMRCEAERDRAEARVDELSAENERLRKAIKTARLSPLPVALDAMLFRALHPTEETEGEERGQRYVDRMRELTESVERRNEKIHGSSDLPGEQGGTRG